MNPSAPTLDPKLAETYNRIMGAELPKAASSPASEARQGWTGNTGPKPEPTQTPAPAQHVYVASGTPGETTEAFTAKKPRKISPVILITLGILFFGAYTIVWLKVFGIF